VLDPNSLWLSSRLVAEHPCNTPLQCCKLARARMPKGVAALGEGFAQSWGRNRTKHPRNAYERPSVLYPNCNSKF
jgi:hypothetical protein